MLIQDQVSWNELDTDWLDFFKSIGVDTIHLETRQAVSVQDHEMNITDGRSRTELFEKAREKVEAKGMKLNNVFFSCPREIPLVGVPSDEDQTFAAATAVAGDSEVQHLTGGTHHSLAIRLGDGVVVVEPPLNEGRSKAVLAKVEELWPGVPVTHLILTHHHYDHMGGIRTYAARGATIVTSALNRAYVEEALSSPHTLVADELARVENPEWHIEAVGPDAEFSLEGGGRTVKARHVPTIHNADLLVVHVPETRLLFVSDIYQPAVFPVGQPLPEPFSDWSQGLRERLPTFGWDVAWIAGGHGGIDSIADFRSHFR